MIRGDIMDKEDVTLLVQLLNAMEDVTKKIEEFYKKKNIVKLNSAKKEILNLQKKVAGVLGR